MKKIIYYISLIISLVLISVSCEVDNYPEPSAKVFGAILDVEGGALVEQDLQSGTLIGTYEQGYGTPVLNNWIIKENGEYRNNLVFPGTYNIVFEVSNFFPFTEENVVFNEGENQHDFTVTPYIRIKNLSITHDNASNMIIARFNLEPGKPTVKLKRVGLFAFTDIHVGEFIKFGITEGNGLSKMSFNPSETIDTEKQYTLTIDLAANSTFDISRNYYFRVGAVGDQEGVGTVKANYAPYVKIAL